MSVSVLNTDSSLSGKTISAIENDETITGAKTFDRDPSAPFAVTAGSAVVTNLDADKVDGKDAADLAQLATANAFTDTTDSTTSTTGAIKTAGGLGVAKAANIGTNLAVEGATDSTSATTGSLKTAGGLGVAKAASIGGVINALGGQIAFPATQSASTDANTLDDYEEGTFTPIITGSTSASGQAYSVQVGKYIKIGRLVFVTGRVTLSTLGTITGTVGIGGLPFAADSTTNADGGASLGYFQNLTTSVVSIFPRITPASSVIFLSRLTAAATSPGEMAQADLSATSHFRFSATYMTDN